MYWTLVRLCVGQSCVCVCVHSWIGSMRIHVHIHLCKLCTSLRYSTLLLCMQKFKANQYHFLSVLFAIKLPCHVPFARVKWVFHLFNPVVSLWTCCLLPRAALMTKETLNCSWAARPTVHDSTTSRHSNPWKTYSIANILTGGLFTFCSFSGWFSSLKALTQELISYKFQQHMPNISVWPLWLMSAEACIFVVHLACVG